MYVSFEIAALFPSSYSRVKQGRQFHNKHSSGVWTPSSRSYIVLALENMKIKMGQLE